MYPTQICAPNMDFCSYHYIIFAPQNKHFQGIFWDAFDEIFRFGEKAGEFFTKMPRQSVAAHLRRSGHSMGKSSAAPGRKITKKGERK
ncbi:hypothetical protein [Allofournierella massiliensis]|uniref:hypothetical protein n=1 Tax=Allofournierella massiliensis TaxID=1650663 RepID=UPI0035684D68